MKGTQTEMGLKELFMANSEDHLLLSFTSEKLYQLNRKEEAQMVKEKSLVELGHAKGILEKLVKYMEVNSMKEWLNEIKNKKGDDVKEEFMLTSTVYLLSKLLSEKVSDIKEKEELTKQAEIYYQKAKEIYEKLLESNVNIA
jgi:cellulose biosynthesis protein BcsQ